MPNQPKTPMHSIRVDADLWNAAKLAAAQEGETITAVLRRALEDYCQRVGVTIPTSDRG